MSRSTDRRLRSTARRAARLGWVALPLALACATPGADAPSFCPSDTTYRTASSEAFAEQWCEDAEGRSHGPFLRTSPSGVERARGRYDRDVTVGAWLLRFESGHPFLFLYYDEHGREYGPVYEWYESGALNTYERHDADGLAEAVHFYEDGRRKAHVAFRGGWAHGLATQWYADGSLRAICEVDHGRARHCDRYAQGERWDAPATASASVPASPAR